MSDHAPIAILGGAPDDDQALVARSGAGDDGAFRVLVERYQGEVYNLALRSMGSPAEAEEITQDTFVRLYRSLGRLRFESTLKTWLYRVATNLCRDRWRRTKRRQGEIPLDASLPAEALRSEAPGPHRMAETAQAAEPVQRLLLELSREQREALVLAYVNGLTHDEISRALGCSRGTVASRIRRGLKKLGEHMQNTESNR